MPMACRIASEMMGFSRGNAVPPKCADDHERARQLVDVDLVEKAWKDQRRPSDPETYAEALVQIADAIERQTGKLEKPQYSMDINAVCPHCRNTTHFKVASPKFIRSGLGYC